MVAVTVLSKTSAILSVCVFGHAHTLHYIKCLGYLGICTYDERESHWANWQLLIPFFKRLLGHQPFPTVVIRVKRLSFINLELG